MNRHTYIILALLITFSHQLYAQDVYIDLSKVHQTIDGVGFCHEGDRQNGDTYVINTSIQQMLDNHMSLFRDMFPNKTWEPSKGTYNYTDQRIVNCFQRLKTMQDRSIKTILGIWDVPNWMVTNPSAGGGRRINNFDDFAWFIYSFLKRGKDVYGLTIDYVDVNESTSTSPTNILLTPQEYITLIQKCQALFTANGIQTKMNMGSVLIFGNDLQYCKDIYASVRTLSVAGYPSFHSYRGGSTTGRETVSYWQAWGSWRQTIDRNLWATETDYDAFYYNNPDRYNWQGIEEMAVMYYRNYYIAWASTSAGWYWHPEWPSNNVHTAYMNRFEPGGQIVETSQPDADVMTVAYKHTANKKFVIQVVNQATYAKTVTFHGVPNNKPLTLLRTSEAGDRSQIVGTYTPGGTNFTITLQANSFNTFYGDLETATDNVAPSVPANFRSTGKTSTSVSLAWDASSDNVGVAGYQVFTQSSVLAGSTSATSITIQNLTPNTSYTYLVKAYDAAGNFSSPSTSLTVTTNNTASGPAVVYSNCNYSGTGVALQVGTYTLSQLQALGVANDDVSSLTVQSGYKVTLYADNNFAGTSVVKTASDACLVDDNMNDMTTSLKVETYSPNLAYGRPVVVTSSESAGYGGSNAVDANGTTRWSSSPANNQSIVVDLGSNYNVNRVRLTWEAAYARDYQIQFSTDNINWTTVREFWGKSSAAADDQTGLSGVARYVKVYCINRATSYGFSLYEFEIYGTAGGSNRTSTFVAGNLTETEGINNYILAVYPSPAHDKITVKLNFKWSSGDDIAIYNTAGKKVIHRNITGTIQEFNIASLAAGTYFIKVTNNNTEKTSQKFIKD